MRTTSPIRQDSSPLTADEHALFICETALALKDQSDIDGALRVMRPVWRDMDQRPQVEGLDAAVAADVLLTSGTLLGWISGRRENVGSQEAAKELLDESMTYYKSVGDTKKIGTALSEIAACYWRAGHLKEARTILHEALAHLPAQGNTRARTLIRLTVVETADLRYDLSSRLLSENATLFENISNHMLKGTYHNEVAIVLRNLARSEPRKRDEYLQTALAEFEKSDEHFTLAGNHAYRAIVKNNVGLILFNLSRFKEAHKYLVEAQRFAARFRDKVRVAEIDETRAQVFIAEKKLNDAETAVRQSIQVFEKCGQGSLLAQALVTHGIALARLNENERALFTLERAFEVATEVGAPNVAGLAALTMIEELPDLSQVALQSAFERASEGLAASLNQELNVRFFAAANKVYAVLNQELKTAPDSSPLIPSPCSLQEEVLKFEGTLIRRALAQANGSVTRAASLLSLSYQALAYIIGGRQKSLLNERTPVRRRGANKNAARTR